MITSHDMLDFVIRSLDGREDGFDVNAIVDDLQAEYGTVDLDSDAVDNETYWEIVARHDLEVTAAQTAEAAAAAFRVTRDERTIEFAVSTDLEAVTRHGTAFVPNHCSARVYGGKVVSIGLDRLDKNGWGIDDPDGPVGAELNASYSTSEYVTNSNHLPDIACRAFETVVALLR